MLYSTALIFSFNTAAAAAAAAAAAYLRRSAAVLIQILLCTSITNYYPLQTIIF